MKEDTPITTNRLSALLERLRFKSLPYDEKSSYLRLKARMDKTAPFSKYQHTIRWKGNKEKSI